MKHRKKTNLMIEVPAAGIGRVELTPSGEMRFFDLSGAPRRPPPVLRTKSHSRPKGPKVHSQSAYTARLLTLDGLDELCEFDQVVVIDTTETTVPWAEKIAFSVAVRVRFKPGDDGTVHVLPLDAHAWFFEFKRYVGNPERLAIFTMLDRLSHGSGHSGRVAVVTDSDLGAHQAINARSEPLYGPHLLLDGCTLLYAGDTGSEALNSFIRMCDGACRAVKRAVMRGELTGPPYRRHPLVPSVLLREGRKEEFRIENASLDRVRFNSGVELQAFGIPQGGGERIPLVVTLRPSAS